MKLWRTEGYWDRAAVTARIVLKNVTVHLNNVLYGEDSMVLVVCVQELYPLWFRPAAGSSPLAANMPCKHYASMACTREGSLLLGGLHAAIRLVGTCSSLAHDWLRYEIRIVNICHGMFAGDSGYDPPRWFGEEKPSLWIKESVCHSWCIYLFHTDFLIDSP